MQNLKNIIDFENIYFVHTCLPELFTDYIARTFHMIFEPNLLNVCNNFRQKNLFKSSFSGDF